MIPIKVWRDPVTDELSVSLNKKEFTPISKLTRMGSALTLCALKQKGVTDLVLQEFALNDKWHYSWQASVFVRKLADFGSEILILRKEIGPVKSDLSCIITQPDYLIGFQKEVTE